MKSNWLKKGQNGHNIFEASEENIYSVKFTFLFVQFQTYLSFFWILVHQLKNTHDHWKTAEELLIKTKPCSDYHTLLKFNQLLHYLKPVYIWDMSSLSLHSNNKIVCFILFFTLLYFLFYSIKMLKMFVTFLWDAYRIICLL